MLTVYRLDNLIMEAITNLKEPAGSNKTTIGTYIEVFLMDILSFLLVFCLLVKLVATFQTF